MTTPYFELGCCALKSAEAALAQHSIPLPEIRSFNSHPSVLDCSCDALSIQIGPSRDTSSERNDFASGIGGGTPPELLPSGCFVRSSRTEIIVEITRCVYLQNTLNSECWPPGDCADAIVCPPDENPVRDHSLCAAPAPTKAHETAWLLEDRWAMEYTFPVLWSQCLCEGWCGSQCGDWPQIGCHHNVQWVSSDPIDSGGCGGTKLTYTIDWP